MIPKELIVNLSGALKKSMDFLEGLYILESDVINGKPYWIQDKAYWIKKRGMAIWYEKEDDFESWNIGDIEDIGSSTVFIYSSSYTVGPHETLGYVKTLPISLFFVVSFGNASTIHFQVLFMWFNF